MAEADTDNINTDNLTTDKVNEKLSLGGNIELVGFKQVSMSEVVVVKKLVGSYTRKIQELCNNFQGVSVHLKEIHKIENTSKNEVHVKAIDDGKVFNSEVIDKNLFVALDSALKKVLAEVTSHNRK
jgi:ribosome-associated translation inhibitor RaiA